MLSKQGKERRGEEGSGEERRGEERRGEGKRKKEKVIPNGCNCAATPSPPPPVCGPLSAALSMGGWIKVKPARGSFRGRCSFFYSYFLQGIIECVVANAVVTAAKRADKPEKSASSCDLRNRRMIASFGSTQNQPQFPSKEVGSWRRVKPN